MSEQHLLIAGIGNIFLGDDGFGVEVIKRLSDANLPEAAQVRDFGIRGFDLAYALLDGYDASILVDAVQRGDAPGTVYLIEPDFDGLEALEGHELETHGMSPGKVLRLVKAMGGNPSRVLVVGCEPEILAADEEWRMELSPAVQGAVPEAVALVKTLVADILATVMV